MFSQTMFKNFYNSAVRHRTHRFAEAFKKGNINDQLSQIIRKYDLVSVSSKLAWSTWQVLYQLGLYNETSNQLNK